MAFATQSSRIYIVSIFLFCLVVGLIYPIYHAKALFIVSDPITEIQQTLTTIYTSVTTFLADNTWIQDYVLKPLVRIALLAMIHALTNQIVSWIQGGDAGFVSNLEGELERSANAEGGAFLNRLTGINLCGNLSAYLRVSLRTPGLRAQLECTVTDIVQNIDNFFRNFADGGWPAFISLSLEPQNNPTGAYLIALDAKIAAENNARQSLSESYEAGRQFLGFSVPVEKNCHPISNEAAAIATGQNDAFGTPTAKEKQRFKIKDGPSGQKIYCDIQNETKTPGTLISDTLSKAVGSNIDFLALAPDIDAAIGAIAQAFLQKIITLSTSSGAQSGEGLLGSGAIQDITIPARSIPGASDIILRSDDNLLKVENMISIVDDEIIAVRKDIFAARTAKDAQKLSEMKIKLEHLLEKKGRLISLQSDILLLKNSLMSNDLADYTVRVHEASSLSQRTLNEIQNFTDINTTTGALTSITASGSGDARMDASLLLRNAFKDGGDEITMLADTIAEIDRIASSSPFAPAPSSAEASTTLLALQEKREKAKAEIDVLQILLGKIHTARVDLDNALPADLDAKLAEATTQSLAMNKEIETADALLEEIDAALDRAHTLVLAASPAAPASTP